MSNTTSSPRPQIEVYYQSERSDVLDFVEYGIEEEGVPWHVESMQRDDLLMVAHEAADDSRLGIGIAIGDGNPSRTILQHERMPEDQPVFDVSSPTLVQARLLGANSARLAKRTPLKRIPE
ncbi:glycerol dehydratase reactivase beta/small subunit family protein [Haladaptatus caseinilyticus]|uniref:glycerol dehydratase reactivase beta/small subunit family protein n=1 Tax=Haladaptatus caseinilyticus TaxID=2993314 RepID=UPI00224B4D27|nr:glycerol dehydratase reactivase beta/small subunit family protein [Haladaptatus caseinilyticus]